MKQQHDQAAIWDMDGVIVDSKEQHFKAWQRVLREQGVTLSYEEWLPSFGRKNADILRELLPAGVSPAEIAELSDRKEVYFRQEADNGLETLPGVRQLLTRLRDAGFAQAIGSSAPPENVDFILTKLGIREFFAAIVTALDIDQGKPHPQVFLVAAQRLRVSLHRSVVFEDAVPGVEAAKAGGMAVIAVTNTRTREDLHAADIVVDSLEEVTIDVIEALVSAH